MMRDIDVAKIRISLYIFLFIFIHLQSLETIIILNQFNTYE